ncbi:MAG TPA: hypothetical protein VGS41_13435 [Chthonomonadales bacterium]|nr:hypothetical protein [Chthonomonadales bacterium]
MAVQTAAPESGHTEPSTQRRDAWWLSPALFFILFTAFAIWATFRAFENRYYHWDHYLTPFYSPYLPIHLSIGTYVISPALYILVFPLSFRLTCYYYRKQIYRAYLADPPGCAVKEPQALHRARFKRYTGERVLPFVLMNFHRYAFYAAVVFIVILWKDAIDAFFFTGPGGATHPGVHLGTLIFLVNICLLTLYTFSCHSWRHLIGGGLDCYSCSLANRTRYGLWNRITALNQQHGVWAMTSLVSVGLTDLYVRFVCLHPGIDFKIL